MFRRIKPKIDSDSEEHSRPRAEKFENAYLVRRGHMHHTLDRTTYGSPNKAAMPAERQLERLKAERDKRAERDKEISEEIERLGARVPLEEEVKEKLERSTTAMKEAEQGINEAKEEAKRLNVDPRWWDEKLEGQQEEDARLDVHEILWGKDRKYRHRHRNS